MGGRSGTKHAGKTVTAIDGNIYALPEVNDCYHCSMSQKMWIYEPWLKKLGLEMPKTTDELYNVLKAFKENDPNGNGKKDEIPLSITQKSWRSTIDAFLMNSFIYNPVYGSSSKHMFIKDGKLDVAFNKPEWREGLRYLNKLYKEGLIAPESFTQDENQLIQQGKIRVRSSWGHPRADMKAYSRSSWGTADAGRNTKRFRR